MEFEAPAHIVTVVKSWGAEEVARKTDHAAT